MCVPEISIYSYCIIPLATVCCTNQLCSSIHIKVASLLNVYTNFVWKEIRIHEYTDAYMKDYQISLTQVMFALSFVLYMHSVIRLSPCKCNGKRDQGKTKSIVHTTVLDLSYRYPTACFTFCIRPRPA